MAQYDVCVIGAGPSGFAAAMRAWDFGKKVCIIERGALGGTGIHNGALSSKTLWELSLDYRNALRRDRGYTAENVSVDYAQVVHCVEVAIDEKVRQIQRQLDELSEPRPGHPGSLTLLRGMAHFQDANKVLVEGTDIGDLVVTADYFVVATGSRPRAVPTLPIDGHTVMTSDHIMRLDRFPRSLVILGAGVVGCEFATIFANFGQTKVYLIDRADRILPFEDEDVSRVCSRNLERKGVTVHHRAKLVGMEVVEGEVEYTIQHHTGGQERIRVEKALVSIGRIPNTRNLGLEAAGVALDERGYIVDNDTQSSVEHIYAVGDVTEDLALVSVGEIEGRHAMERIWGGKTKKLSYENISSIYFLDPEVAACGLSEQEAQRQGRSYKVAVYGYELVNRAIAMRAAHGFVKILVTDNEELRILGMRALGAHASTTIEAVALLMAQDRSIRDVAELLHPHPAVTEAVQECVRMLLGNSIYKPQVFTSELRLSRVTYSETGAKTLTRLMPISEGELEKAEEAGKAEGAEKAEAQ